MDDKKLIRDVEPPRSKRSIRRVNLDRKQEREKKVAAEDDAPSRPEPAGERAATEEYAGGTDNATHADESRHDEYHKMIDEPEHPSYASGQGGGNGNEKASAYLARRRKRYPKVVAWLLALVSLVIVVVAVASLFSSVEVEITPLSRKVTVDKSFTARENAAAGEFEYELVTIKSSAEETITSSLLEEKEVEERASGQITIYNEYTTQDQRLVKNTRFEAPDGRIYKIPESVVVPGMTEGESGITPGSITVTVYADQAGEEYNLESAEFTVPGFEGMPQFDAFYAKTAKPITGGFKGTRKVAPEAEEKRIKDALEARLKEKLRMDASGKAPDDFVLFDGMSTVSTVSFEQVSGAGNPKFKAEAELTGVMFKRDAFSEVLAGALIKELGVENATAEVRNPEDLSVTLETDTINQEAGEIPFSVSGETEIVLNYDEEELKKELAGRSRDEVKDIVGDHPTVCSVNVIMRPFWKDTFPQEPEEIKVSEKIDFQCPATAEAAPKGSASGTPAAN